MGGWGSSCSTVGPPKEGMPLGRPKVPVWGAGQGLHNPAEPVRHTGPGARLGEGGHCSGFLAATSLVLVGVWRPGCCRTRSLHKEGGDQIAPLLPSQGDPGPEGPRGLAGEVGNKGAKVGMAGGGDRGQSSLGRGRKSAILGRGQRSTVLEQGIGTSSPGGGDGGQPSWRGDRDQAS